MKAGALYQAVRKANLKVVLWRVQILKSTEYQYPLGFVRFQGDG
ncbi:hypothetical protein PDIG_91300 [Penicillium digitatum PHI26]|uniref:Uncharacterized protein n=2 Tax=Penicillium digitatum TaxID=36651 RepID=K9FSN1_PEND2|nr:hypothetical protein PDIP_87380 [Penicillium digitatum Pd1]EKV04076.1 hypothetical protein PDIG_91300 [Penicillium digitatum PHI26]EKV04405.1 hypothetical protein PDIP_87380 [Penicillium digitatum Pd1]